jgi:Ca2+:H+ antiporter
VGRKLLWASLALAPATALVDRLAHPGDVTIFVLAAIALIPLAWLIGESTEHAAEHTGPGIGGFLNASFGNAPELIIALFAVADGLPGVVRGSLSGSVISNLLLVLGFACAIGPDGSRVDKRSLFPQILLVGAAVVAFVLPAALGYTGDPERHAVVVASIPVSIVLLLAYLVVTTRNLRRHRAKDREEPAAGAWSLPLALAVLGVATVATAYVSELLVHSLDAFAKAAGLSEFFTAAVIVAIVGNAAEHGSAVLIARTGNMPLATEISISSSAQVGVLVTPVVMLLSLAFTHPLALSFRWEELAAMAVGVAVAFGVVWDGRTRRWEGALLLTAYAAVVVGFALAGNR